ncbi:MAG: class I SAM-dependent methyltransferase [Verrucomicrobiae bacterium]|nr:class I SAM-dependent methyltransferase [Verrucomicrobiae bacterium]
MELESIPVEDLINEYRRQLNIDLSEEFRSHPGTLSRAACPTCHLEHFSPLIAGSPDFYQSVSKIGDYYAGQRWEFGAAAALIPASANVVDVGCGDGQFLGLLTNERKIGLEHNPDAITRARARGLDVRPQMLEELEPASADVITLFQVLEHLPNPRPIIETACRVLRPNGRLLIAVPNNDSFVGDLLHAPLNAPPHHVLRWSRRPLEHLPKIAPLVLETIECEPLPEEQLFDYRRASWIRFVSRMVFTRPPVCALTSVSKLIRKLATALTFASLKIDQTMPTDTIGHTILAVYGKST